MNLAQLEYNKATDVTVQAVPSNKGTSEMTTFIKILFIQKTNYA